MVALLPLCLCASACSGRLGHRIERPVSGSFELPSGTHTLRVRVPEGQLSFYADPAPRITFDGMTLRAADDEDELRRLEPLDFTLHPVSAEPGVFALQAPDLPPGANPRKCLLALRAEIRVPDAIAIDARTGNGPIGARGRRAAVTLTTGHGDVVLQDCEGDAVLRGSGGKLIVDDHRGSLDAEGSEFMIQAFVRRLGANGVRLVNRNGAIQAHLPHDAGFELDLRAYQGEALNSFGIRKDDVTPLPEEPGTDPASTVRGVWMHGRVGGGGPPVVLISRRGGNVSLQAKVFEPPREAK